MNQRTSPLAKRIGGAKQVESHRGTLAIFAPDLAQAISDFAYCDRCFNTIQNSRQDILRTARSFFQFSQRSVCFGGISSLTQGSHSLDLRLFDGWIDTQRRDW